MNQFFIIVNQLKLNSKFQVLKNRMAEALSRTHETLVVSMPFWRAGRICLLSTMNSHWIRSSGTRSWQALPRQLNREQQCSVKIRIQSAVFYNLEWRQADRRILKAEDPQMTVRQAAMDSELQKKGLKHSNLCKNLHQDMESQIRSHPLSITSRLDCLVIKIQGRESSLMKKTFRWTEDAQKSGLLLNGKVIWVWGSEAVTTAIRMSKRINKFLDYMAT